MNIAFIISNWDEIKPDNSATLTMIHECCLRGHMVCVGYPRNLTVRNNIAHGFFKVVQPMAKISDNLSKFHRSIEFKEKLLPLHGLDSIFIRKDPPIDPIMLNFLDSVKNEAFIMNAIEGLRTANNKLYTTTFHDPNNSFLPVTHVSKNKEFLLRVIEESSSSRMILKPLSGSGGHGVIVLEKDAKANINSLIDFYIGDEQRNYVIIQEFVEGAEKGDVRVLMLNGQPIGAYRRVPAPGEVRANIHAGGSPVKHVLTESQKAVCKKIGPKLIADGLYFAGLDLIGDKLIEVNVMNPGGIPNINRLNKVKLQKKVIDYIEEKVEEREEKRLEVSYLLQRLDDFRKSSPA